MLENTEDQPILLQSNKTANEDSKNNELGKVIPHTIDNYLAAAKIIGKVFAPLLVDNIIFYSAGFVDGVIVGRLGTTVLAASSIISNLKLFITVPPLAAFYSLPTLIVLGQQEADPKHHVGQLSRAALLLAAGFSIVIIPGLLVSSLLVDLIEPSYKIYVQDYFNFFVISVPAQFLVYIINNFLLSTDKSFATIPFSLLRTVTEIGSSAFMIYGLNMGVKGWGIATGVQPWLSMLLVAPVLLNQKVRAYLRQHGILDRFRLNRDLINPLKDILKLGLPILLQSLFIFTNGLVGSLLAGRLGNDELASYQIASSVALWSVMLFDPFIGTLSIILPNITERNSRSKIFRTAIGMSVTGSTLLILLPTLFYRQIVTLYNPSTDLQHENIVSISRTLIPVMSLTAPIHAIKTITTGIQRSEKKAIRPLVAEAVGTSFSTLFALLAALVFEDIRLLSIGQMTGLLIGAIVLATVLCEKPTTNSGCLFGRNRGIFFKPLMDDATEHLQTDEISFGAQTQLGKDDGETELPKYNH